MAKYYVYVIKLDSQVNKIKRFREANPKYKINNDCFYVGQSVRKPELRFEQHKEGYKSNRYAKKYGIRLEPEFYKKYNPIPTRRDAEKIEKYLAESLRDDGYGIWCN